MSKRCCTFPVIFEHISNSWKWTHHRIPLKIFSVPSLCTSSDMVSLKRKISIPKDAEIYLTSGTDGHIYFVNRLSQLSAPVFFPDLWGELLPCNRETTRHTPWTAHTLTQTHTHPPSGEWAQHSCSQRNTPRLIGQSGSCAQHPKEICLFGVVDFPTWPIAPPSLMEWWGDGWSEPPLSSAS